MKLQRQKYLMSNSCNYVFLAFLLMSVTIFGQKKEKDSSKFVFYPEKILIRTNLSTQTDAYSLESKNGDNLSLLTNNNYKLFFSVDYKFIGFSYGFYPNFFGGNNDEDLKGKSTFSDYNFRFFLGKWLQTAKYSKTKGYYVENTNDFLPDWNEGIDPYLQFPNFKTTNYGMSTSYIFNPKFSLKSITSFTEWQKESAGSFIPTLLYDYTRITYAVDELKEKEIEYDIRLGTGYYYNFIILNRFYIAPYLTPSLGVKFASDKTVESGEESIEKNTYFTTNFDGGFRMGYNSDHVLFGFSFNFNTSAYNENRTDVVSDNKAFGLLYFGYRFNAPKFIKKPVDYMESKMKF